MYAPTPAPIPAPRAAPARILSALPSPSTAPTTAPAAAPMPAPLAVLSRVVVRVALDCVPVVAHPNGVITAKHRRTASQRLLESFCMRHLLLEELRSLFLP